MLSSYLDKDASVYTTLIPQVGEFSFRLLTLQEFKRISILRNNSFFSKWELEEEVFAYCYLGKSSFLKDNLPAGITISIGSLILWLSGDCDTSSIVRDIQVSRKLNPVNTLHEYMRAVILSAFPAYTLEDIEAWDRLEFVRKFTISENTLKKKDEAYEFLDLSLVGKPEKTKKKDEQKIDFAAENAAIMKSQGRWEVEEALEKIDKTQAKMLDRRR
jgi:hypothetical protein